MNRTELYLSADNTKCLKGICAVGVLFHHLYQYSGIVNNHILAFCLQYLGYLSVGIFFFYSGYGLMLSSHRNRYIDTFLRKRLLPFYVFLIVVYVVYKTLLNISISFNEIIQSFLFGETIVPLGWYLQVTILLYLVYWTVFRLIKRDTLRLGTIFLLLMIFYITCYFLGLSSTWYQGVLCFWVGMAWFYKKDKIDSLLKEKEVLSICTSVILFAAFTILQLKFGVVVQILMTISFVIAVITFTYILANTHVINNRFTQFLGKYSLEIYVC